MRSRIQAFLFTIGTTGLLFVSGSVNHQVLAGQTQDQFWIPQFGHGRLGALQFSSEISLINLSTTASTATISTFAEDGSPSNLLGVQATPQSRTVVEIAPLGTSTISSLNENPSTEIDLGWAAVSSFDDIGVEVRFKVQDVTQPPLFTDTNVRPQAPRLSASFFGFLNDAMTGVAILKPPTTPNAATVTIVALDAMGNIVGQAEQSLANGEKISRFLGALLPGLGTFTGSVEIRATEPISILPLRQEGIVLTTQEVFPARELPLEP